MSAGLAPARHGRLPPSAGHNPGARARLDHLIKIEDAALFGRRADGSPPRRPDRPSVEPHAWPKGSLNPSDPDHFTRDARIAPCGRVCGRSWRPA
jgi:hypothetical protein